MSILKVARMGHPVLREKAQALDRTALRSPAIQKLIDDLIDTMIEYHGVGLAAPQVHESVRVFVAQLGPDDPEVEAEPIVIVNPQIVPAGPETVDGWEGCLSIPDIRGRVPRARHIALRALDRNGDRLDLSLNDFPARVAQHEADHLDGILFFDRMPTMASLTFLDEYARYWAKD
jgi:peptide deformylase